MEPIHGIWRPHRVPLKISKFPEIEKETSILRSLIATTATKPKVAEGLTEMFVAGVSTQKVGAVAQTLMGVAPSASTVSRLNQTLTQQFETWRERHLQGHWRIVYLDGVYPKKAAGTDKYCPCP